MEKAMDSYNKGGGAGEVRRINVVYFLSRGGRTDHPHLFRVNHLHRSGVRLRDVKRWLSEVRGKDMPENFSWAYKRKYKAGYVWQDLMDDDLITPISDNEYVLKGCDVRGTPPPPPPCADVPKPSSLADEKKLHRTEEKGRKQAEEELQAAPDSDESSPKPPPPIDQDSPSSEGEAAHFRIVLPLDLEERKRRQQEAARRAVTTEWQALVVRAAAPGVRKQQPAVGRARRMRVARVLHSILTCGAADSVDAAALQPVALPRARGGSDDDEDRRDTTPVCPGMDGCGIQKVRLRRSGKDKAKPEGGKRPGAVAAAHKPASLPLCSQCGKEFKPQDLHSHMQSCRGFRARMRSSNGTRGVDRNHTRSARADDSSPERTSTGLLLTQS
ncbi:protein SOSEKI 1 isoform X2 [Triticum urartu]|uniref:protein SOSEKI 1 isoform X2 n=1 Tax=Triticum urartu TaxID=4572 RepID=UPI002044BC06|nr:protein SOSEKI 1 isoform X2 [Triticum urartu]